jgi:cellulose synthase/poly-beta-1,6-N-acetylglucosamine synthase-like glycosyltransferase
MTGYLSGGCSLALVGLASAVLLCLVVGYLAWLVRGHPPGAKGAAPALVGWPRVDVVVPVHNEATLIEGKLANLSALRYPRDRVRILIVDGNSSDRTSELVEAWIRHEPGFQLVRLPLAHKVVQLNAALAHSDADWVLVTDGDAWLPQETLCSLVTAGEADADLAVVGTPVEPAHTHPLERRHWALTNYLRQAESRRGSASIVAGPCYLFRRRLLRHFPEDVVADDVHVAFAAAASGARVGYVHPAVTELRSPTHLRELFWHKVRKADAYLREVFRFLPRLGAMRSPAREVFLWHAAQMLVVPTLLGAVLIGLVGWLAGTRVTPDGALLTGSAAALVATGASMADGRARRLAEGMALGMLLMLVLLTALLAYPFSRQSACYPKVVSARPARVKAVS